MYGATIRFCEAESNFRALCQMNEVADKYAIVGVSYTLQIEIICLLQTPTIAECLSLAIDPICGMQTPGKSDILKHLVDACKRCMPKLKDDGSFRDAVARNAEELGVPLLFRFMNDVVAREDEETPKKKRCRPFSPANRS